jgi:hypothetical protein
MDNSECLHINPVVWNYFMIVIKMLNYIYMANLVQTMLNMWLEIVQPFKNAIKKYKILFFVLYMYIMFSCIIPWWGPHLLSTNSKSALDLKKKMKMIRISGGEYFPQEPLT